MTSHRTYPVEVVKRGSEFVHLLLGESLGVSHEDLVLNLVDRQRHGGLQMLPADPDVFHAVLGLDVAEDQRFLDDLRPKEEFTGIYRRRSWKFTVQPEPVSSGHEYYALRH